VAIDVIMPQMGADMTEGTVVRWLKQPGDEVKRGEALAEIETDKATVELEAFDSGILKKVVVPEGDTVPVGQVIAILGSPDEQVDVEPERLPRHEAAERHITDRPLAAPAAAAPPAATPGHDDPGRKRISPVARRIAEDAGIDPATITGSGPEGRVLRRDVEAAIAARKAAPAPEPPTPREPEAARELAPARPTAAVRASQPFTGETEVVPLNRMRQTIARRMVQSKTQQPHYYLTLDIDMTDALAFRKQVNASLDEGDQVTINDLVVKAVALALERHPKFNGEYSDEGLKLHKQINIDIAVALDEGLIAPAIIDAGNKSLGRIAREARDLIARARSGHLRADEYSAGTFSITNLGNFGVETLIGIIKPPHAAILGVGSVMPQPVVREGEIVVRQVMKVALSADHRVSDGAEGARFIKEIQRFLENPVLLVL
jgi:pyruvate dehydrogenase E2 component (dihydrolipoamide acetyltransferase)